MWDISSVKQILVCFVLERTIVVCGVPDMRGKKTINSF